MEHDGPDEPSISARTRGKDRPAERRMGALLTSPNRKHRAPPFGTWSLSIRRPRFVLTRRRGLLLTRVLVHTLIHGPAWASPPSSWTSIQGQHQRLRGSKSSTYRVWGASSMPPRRPLQLFHFHPQSPFDTHARLRWERALAPDGAALTSALSPGSRPTYMLKAWTNQRERQNWTTHLSSIAAPETLIVLGLHSRSRTRT